MKWPTTGTNVKKSPFITFSDHHRIIIIIMIRKCVNCVLRFCWPKYADSPDDGDHHDPDHVSRITSPSHSSPSSSRLLSSIFVFISIVIISSHLFNGSNATKGKRIHPEGIEEVDQAKLMTLLDTHQYLTVYFCELFWLSQRFFTILSIRPLLPFRMMLMLRGNKRHDSADDSPACLKSPAFHF